MDKPYVFIFFYCIEHQIFHNEGRDGRRNVVGNPSLPAGTVIGYIVSQGIIISSKGLYLNVGVRGLLWRRGIYDIGRNAT